ncbi:MAG: uracil-DNA glycosylase [Thaumarchaeota archaeon]|nr:uracil-DNA glycosylase [Nitrososphaerota archaeon]
MNINKINNQITSCTQCILHKHRKNAVPGIGNICAEIMMIGEAPGIYEDELGLPFVGRAGHILYDILMDNGIPKSSLYITNVIKCRPPKNRIPNKKEINECKIYLMREINLIKPKIICIMGNIAYSTILGGKNIIKNRGRLVFHDNQRYFLTIHPAATIYNKNLFVLLKNDIQTLCEFISKY